MRLTKFTHACVRIEDGANVLVIDPGQWSEPESLARADAVLVTHEHLDHLDADKLSAAVAANPDLRIITHADVAEELDAVADAVTVVAPGDSFDAAGFRVHTVGGEHADIYDGLPGCANVGFTVDTPAGALYHPGDALHVPRTEVDTLLVPTSAPWLKLAEAIDFVRAVAPRRAFSIHDALMNDLGWMIADRWLTMKSDTEYARIPVGDHVEL